LDKLLDVARNLLVLERLPHAVDDLIRRDGADIGEIQTLLQFAQEVLIDASFEAKQVYDAAEEAARLGQALLDFAEDCTEHNVSLIRLFYIPLNLDAGARWHRAWAQPTK